MARAIVNRGIDQANRVGAFINPGGGYSQQQRMIVEAFRAEEYIKDKMDVQAEPIFDTNSEVAAAVITTGKPTAQFFTNISGKGPQLTNMTQPNELMNPEALSIFAYRYYLDPRNSILDSESVMAGFRLDFIMGRKPYQSIPLWQIPQGGGIDVQGCCDGCVVHNGRPTKEAIRPIAITLILEQGVRFEGILNGDASYTIDGATFIHQLNLDGLHARGVQ
jgi:hypothetical protein